MRNRVFRSIAAILAILVLTGIPAQAGPVAIRQVVQVMSTNQNPPAIRLREGSQNLTALTSRVTGSVQPNSVVSVRDASLGAPVVTSTDSLLSGLAMDSDPQTSVDIIDAGDVEGTICDCGEILVAAGGFPKWPLLFLAAIPLFLIHDCTDCDTPLSSTPTPTAGGLLVPTQTSISGIPEPASLLLFGTGLAAFGAGLRRRFAKAKLKATEEV